eukprot:72832-Chlamydomonas_euryale.AAC.13
MVWMQNAWCGCETFGAGAKPLARIYAQRGTAWLPRWCTGASSLVHRRFLAGAQAHGAERTPHLPQPTPTAPTTPTGATPTTAPLHLSVSAMDGGPPRMTNGRPS